MNSLSEKLELHSSIFGHFGESCIISKQLRLSPSRGSSKIYEFLHMFSNDTLDYLQQIAAKGGSLEYSDSVGARPLHIAAANGYLSVVEFLLDHHVATDSKDNDGWQPIHAAACWLHVHKPTACVYYSMSLTLPSF